MHIVHATSFFLPCLGGIEQYVYQISKRLVKRGHKVTVYTSRTPKDANPEEWIDGILVKRLKPTGHIFGYPIMPSLSIEMLRQKADIFHAHINAPFVVESVSATSLLENVPLVITYNQGSMSLKAIFERNSVFSNSLGLAYQGLLSFDFKIARKIIVVSKAVMKFSGLFQKFQSKVTYIPNGVDTDWFTSEGIQSESSKTSIPKNDNEKVILFVGRFVAFKGVDVLLKAVRLLIKKGLNVRVVLVGNGPLRTYLMDIARKFLQDKATFIGAIPHAKLPVYYRASDVFVYPSKTNSDGMPLAILEALACGVPVVASNVGGIPCIFDGAECGILVPPNKPKALASAIECVLSEESFRYSLSKNAREHALSFSWDKITKQIEKVYNEVQHATDFQFK
jgi:glycosyltransferase involved in cell wall biosynthesis